MLLLVSRKDYLPGEGGEEGEHGVSAGRGRDDDAGGLLEVRVREVDHGVPGVVDGEAAHCRVSLLQGCGEAGLRYTKERQ